MLRYVRFYLKLVYWHPQILSDLARDIGVPLRFDYNTISGEFGHFARVLVDVDHGNSVPNFLVLNRSNGCIKMYLSYENLPEFCSVYSSVGHINALIVSSLGKSKRLRCQSQKLLIRFLLQMKLLGIKLR